jgi:hypothetical protein
MECEASTYLALFAPSIDVAFYGQCHRGGIHKFEQYIFISRFYGKALTEENVCKLPYMVSIKAVW